MIIKLIEASGKAVRTNGYARGLAKYMADADRNRLRPDAVGADYGMTISAYMVREDEEEEPSRKRERVLHKAALVGGQASNWELGLADLENRLAHKSSRNKKPVRHAVISYRAGEQPGYDECAQAVAILTNELGCNESAVLWAAHADTDNIHIHVLFVTVDAEDGSALSFGHGPGGSAAYKEAMQRAIARIEDAQNLEAERGARYEVVDGHVVRKSLVPREIARRTPLHQEVLDFESRTGFASFTRVAQELAAPVLETAHTWEEVHLELARIGMAIRPSGKGGELYAGHDHVKLSNVDRPLSWGKLTKCERLGSYREASDDLVVVPFEPRVLDAEKASMWLARMESERQISTQLDRRIAHLMDQRDATLVRIKTDHETRQIDLAKIRGDARLARDLLAAMARMKAQSLLAIKAEFACRIAAVRGLRRSLSFVPNLSLLNVEEMGSLDFGIMPAWGPKGLTSPKVFPVKGFHGEPAGDLVRYWSDADTARVGVPAFVDTGAVIWVNERSDAAIEACLRIAHARFGAVAVFGDQAYRDQCKQVGSRLGINIEEITLQEARRRATKVENPKDLARRAAASTAMAREGHQPPQKLSPTPPDGHLINNLPAPPEGAVTDNIRAKDAENIPKQSSSSRSMAADLSTSEPQTPRALLRNLAFLAWQQACREKSTVVDRQRLASLAMKDGNVRKLALRSPSPELKRLALDVQEHERRLIQIAEHQRQSGKGRI